MTIATIQTTRARTGRGTYNAALTYTNDPILRAALDKIVCEDVSRNKAFEGFRTLMNMTGFAVHVVNHEEA